MQSSKDSSVFFSKHEAENERVIYASGANIVKLDLENNSQKVFFGTNNNIGHTCQNFNGSYIATIESCKSPCISIIDVNAHKVIRTWTSDVDNVKALTFNCDSSALAVFGVDPNNKTKIVVYNVAGVHLGQEPTLLATQLTDFDVN